MCFWTSSWKYNKKYVSFYKKHYKLGMIIEKNSQNGFFENIKKDNQLILIIKKIYKMKSNHQ